MMSQFRELMDEFGYMPASTDPAHLAARRERDARDQAQLDAGGAEKWSKMGQTAGPR
jgi:hypothetical protein